MSDSETTQIEAKAAAPAPALKTTTQNGEPSAADFVRTSAAGALALGLLAQARGQDLPRPPMAPPAPVSPDGVFSSPILGPAPSASNVSNAPLNAPAPAPRAPGYYNVIPASDDEAAAFLQQAQFSSTRAEINALRTTTYDAWLTQQFGAPASETLWDWLDRRGYYNIDAAAFTAPFDPPFYNNTYPADYALWRKLFSAPDAVRQRATLALSELFVVSLNAANMTWMSFACGHWWDMLSANAFGNFRTLLEEVTLNPVMGAWLNTKGNRKESASGRVPDENYAREVMQLFTIGLYKLNLDGTIATDANGNPVDSYTQDDVTNLARIFTGYDHDIDSARYTVTRTDGTTFTIAGRDFTRKKMRFNPAEHSILEKRFLGVTIAASATATTASGAEDLRIAMDTLFNHPNVGPFVGKQMIQRLVTSNPSPAYVRRVAQAFNDNGAGVRGDLKAMWRAILLDDEARDAQNKASTTFGKLREPMVRFVQWGRTFGFNSAAGSWKLGDTSSTSSRLGQSPLRSPSVFNFFRPGFVPPSTQLALTKSVAPEFQIANETTVAAYINFMQSMIRSGQSVREPTLPQSVSTGTAVADMAAAYTDELAIVLDAAALVKHVNTVLCAGRISSANQALMKTALEGVALTAASTQTQMLDRVAAAVLMAMASSDYLVQR